MKKYSRMFMDLAVGILICGLITELVILILPDKKIYNSIGLLVGMMYAYFMLLGINASVEDSVLMTESEALKHTRIKYILRVIVLVVLLALFWIFDFGNAVTFIIGAFALKFATYLQPVMDKLVGHYFDN